MKSSSDNLEKDAATSERPEEKHLYRVVWEIDLEAASPRDAAERALAIQRNPDSIAVVFEVRDKRGHRHKVDLLEEGFQVELRETTA